MSFLKVPQAFPSRGRCHPGVTDEVSVLQNLINSSMLVKIAEVREADSASLPLEGKVSLGGDG